MLPFLPLDGGHILFALIEFFRRKPLAREVYERVSLIGIVAMLMLFAIGLSNDVSTSRTARRSGRGAHRRRRRRLRCS